MIFHFINNFINQIAWNTYSKPQAEIIKIFADRGANEEKEKHSNYFVLSTLVNFFSERNIKIELDIDSKLKSKYEYSKLLLIVIYDIISNSTKYGDGTIRINAQSGKNKLNVSISNKIANSHSGNSNRNNSISKSLLELLNIGEIDFYKENNMFYSILRLG